MVSLGSERTIAFRSQHEKKLLVLPSRRLPGPVGHIAFRSQHEKKLLEHYLLKSGSLLYMRPEMQREWKHAILAAKDLEGGRISLTFRQMKPVA